MVIQSGLIIHHALLLVLCFFLILNRYLNQKRKHIVSVILNLFITATIVNIGLLYGILKAVISILLYFMYMIILNIIIFYIIQKKDKSSTLLEELKKKNKRQR